MSLNLRGPIAHIFSAGRRQIDRLSFPRVGRERFNVAHHFDDRGAAA
jgi:hypothetical protein